MHNFFGKKKDPGPGVEDRSNNIIQKKNERIENMEKNINKINKQLLVVKKEYDRLRPGPAKKAKQQRLLHLLKHRKKYEANMSKQWSMIDNMDQNVQMLEDVKATHEMINLQKEVVKTYKKQTKSINIDKLHDMNDDLIDIREDHEEIQEIIAGPDVDDMYNEDELLDELEALDEDDMNLLDDVTINAPDAPTCTINSTSNVDNKDKIEVDEFGLPVTNK
ncbi:Charged multivesicular body protein 5 [Intoshia linei]|uniref:Charged multivesicular body protein 5 n=1 Tax=Intoshia linei TaxID=1819745 RepID=A0A177B7A1_9BILA|nr:Charged multivesicular body protein 5 [Intoshia linei]